MTIYALSTGPGIYGIAIIRVSGEEIKKFIKLVSVITYIFLLKKNTHLPMLNWHHPILDSIF